MRHRLYLHIVWTVRNREPMITGPIAERLCEILPPIAIQERTRLLEIGIVANHLHLLVRVHPTTSIPRLLQRLKGVSGAVTKIPWAKGYNVDAVSERMLDIAARYVRDQHRHHPEVAIAGFPEGASPPGGAIARALPSG